jgi:hypothetical protein
MNCEPVREQLFLYLYGELSFDEEEHVDEHLDTCADCKQALVHARELHESLHGIATEPSPTLLRSCREDLWQALKAEPAPQVSAPSWWQRFTESISFHHDDRSLGWLKPLGAVALLALGFFGARVTPDGASSFGFMGFSNPNASRVRYVSPGEDGRVQIVIDETRQRTVTGEPDDSTIRALLLSAARDPSDPGLRAETLTILQTHSEGEDVRGILLEALEHDQNAGVRLKALQGLRPFAHDRAVQSALARVLLSDTNPGIRTQAIDLLTADAGTDRQIVGALQELMSRESNDYIRDRGQKLLEAVNASAEIY